MKTITKKAADLLRSQFLRDGVRFCSGTHTTDGTLPLWGQLQQAGLVKEMSKIWHPFAFELTPSGATVLDGKFSKRHIGTSTDHRTNRWELICPQCFCRWCPSTTMLAERCESCPKCEFSQTVNYND